VSSWYGVRDAACPLSTREGGGGSRGAARAPASTAWRSRSIAAAWRWSCADSASACAPRAAPGSESCEQWRNARSARLCAQLARGCPARPARAAPAPRAPPSPPAAPALRPPRVPGAGAPPCRDAEPNARWWDWSKAVKCRTGGGEPAAAKRRAGRRAVRCAERAPHSAAPPVRGRARARAQPLARADATLSCGRVQVRRPARCAGAGVKSDTACPISTG
jgi:hypothetical protein